MPGEVAPGKSNMIMGNTRRAFLGSLGLLPLLIGAKANMRDEHNARPKIRLRYSVNAYSFNDKLRNGEMTLFDMMEYAADIGLDAVDLTGYYFSSYPDVPANKELYQLKRKALELGLDISWTGIRNDFTNPDPTSRAADRELIRKWLTASSKLGSPLMRVFAGTNKHEGYPREKVKEWLVEEFKICAQYGEETGVLPALQHHNDFLFTSDEVIDILKRVDSEWFGLILDVGSLSASDPYEEIARLVPYADYCFIKEHVHPSGIATPVDMKKIAQILRNGDYSGYVSFESLSDGDPKQIVKKMHQSLKMEIDRLGTE
jgi:sugar phosphate isomerase/epimerase